MKVESKEKGIRHIPSAGQSIKKAGICKKKIIKRKQKKKQTKLRKTALKDRQITTSNKKISRVRGRLFIFQEPIFKIFVFTFLSSFLKRFFFFFLAAPTSISGEDNSRRKRQTARTNGFYSSPCRGRADPTKQSV